MAPEAMKGERTMSELAAEYGVHPTIIHQWKRSLLEGASDIFERGEKRKTEVDEETVRYINGFYNPKRRHSALSGKSPVAFEQRAT